MTTLETLSDADFLTLMETRFAAEGRPIDPRALARVAARLDALIAPGAPQASARPTPAGAAHTSDEDGKASR